nr:MAG TPA: alpha-1,4-glucan-4-glucanohydrolase [Caudoviricetes sp.]
MEPQKMGSIYGVDGFRFIIRLVIHLRSRARLERNL